jgi:hypothetical protein
MASGSSSGRGKKAEKPPISSNIGLKMEELMARCKMDKSHKVQHDAVTHMHNSTKGVDMGEKSMLLKKAYIAGYKAAEESMSVNSDDDSMGAAQGKKEEPEEKVIDALRRGWPDTLATARKNHAKAMDREQKGTDGADNGDDVRSRAKINKHSPEVTV